MQLYIKSFLETQAYPYTLIIVTVTPNIAPKSRDLYVKMKSIAFSAIYLLVATALLVYGECVCQYLKHAVFFLFTTSLYFAKPGKPTKQFLTD